ncbi:MAG: hypothetical protein JSS02_14190, partial [Planctomycetes bacterium]|nr:hypothetical protein [Planctomycetota bacterium]
MDTPAVAPMAETSDRPPRSRRPWLISVRIVLVLLVCGALVSGWQGWHWYRRYQASQQIEAMNGWVQYQSNPLPVWLQVRLGPEIADCYAPAWSIDFMCATVNDHALAQALREFPEVEAIFLYATPVGNETLACLSDLPRLRYLNLGITSTTDEQIASLGSLPSLRDLNLH